jgi:signal peptidase I
MTTSRRNPWLAGLATFLAPGLGQVYNGQWRKGLAIGVVWALLPFAYVAVALADDYMLPLMLLVLAVWFGLLILALVDAMMTPTKLGPGYELRRFNRVIVYVGVWLALGTVQTAGLAHMRTNATKAYRITSESMRPTLLVGDHVFVDVRDSSRHPSRAEVMLIHPPGGADRIYLKRVVALKGEQVEIRDKNLLINGKPVSEPYVIHIDPSVHPGILDPRDNFGPSVVPPGSCFVVGDNRDNSNDCRFWGSLPESEVLGKARWIYWSWDSHAGRVRWERIGRRI